MSVYQVESDAGSVLRGVRMRVMSPELVRKMSVVEVTTSGINKDGKPLLNGLNSTMMGSVDMKLICQTCSDGLTGNCPGHNGHIEFPFPLYHIGFKDMVYKLLKMVCYWCSHVLLNLDDPSVQQVCRGYTQQPSQKFQKLCGMTRVYRKCPQCHRPQPRYEQLGNHRIEARWSPDAATLLGEALNRPLSEEESLILRRPFVAADAISILQAVDPAKYRLIGFDPEFSHPSWFIMVNIVVPPPAVRPGNVHVDGGGKNGGRSDLTRQLRDMVHRREEFIKELGERVRNKQPVPRFLFTPFQECHLLGQLEMADNPENDSEDRAAPQPVDPNEGSHVSVELQATILGNKKRLDASKGGSLHKRRRKQDLDKMLNDVTCLYGFQPMVDAMQRVVNDYIRSDGKGLSAQTDRGSKGGGNAKLVTPTTTASKDKGKEPEQDKANPQPAEAGDEGDAAKARDTAVEAQAQARENASSVERITNSMVKDSSGNSICSGLGGKGGRFRGNLVGKRVDFCGRAPITINPLMNPGDVGVPEMGALKLTYPEVVNSTNIQRLQACVRIGPGKLGGAQSVVMKTGKEDQVVNLETFRGDHTLLELRPGYVVNRYMQDGDWVLFNRHPSLHKLSMMAHQVRIHKGKTFQMSDSVCQPYNADFDGDDMNIHLPQNERARAEAQHILAVNKNFLMAKSNKPSFGLIQDGITLSFLLTSRNTFFTRDRMQQLMFQCNHLEHEEHLWSYTMPHPAILWPVPLWTGKQLVSWLLPRRFQYLKGARGLDAEKATPMEVFEDLEERCALVVNGELLLGQLSSELIGSAANSIPHMLALDFDNDRAVHFFTDLKRAALWYGLWKGHTISMYDCRPTPDMRQVARDSIHQAFASLRAFEDELRKSTGLSSLQKEHHYKRILNTVTDRITRGVKAHMRPHNNNMARMVVSGSKGSLISMAHITSAIGQQFIDGERIHPEIDRVLPSFPHADDPTSSSPSYRGYNDRSYYQGLTPSQFFIALLCGRYSLLLISVGVSSIGYLSRTMERSTESKIVRTDGSVRDSSGRIVQYCYAGDRMDGTRLEKVGLEGLLFPSVGRTLDARFASGGVCPTIRKQYGDLLGRLREEVLGLRSMANPMDMSTQYCLPFNPRRLLHNLVRGRTGEPSDKPIDPLTAWRRLKEFLRWLEQQRGEHQSMVTLRLAVVGTLGPWQVSKEHRLTAGELHELVETMKRRYRLCLVAAGESVGCQASEAAAEPNTQGTLNTFHYAGVAAKNVTIGLPRLKELIKPTQDIKTPITTIQFRDGVDQNPELLTREVVDQIRCLRMSGLVRYGRVDDASKQLSILLDADRMGYYSTTVDEVVSAVADFFGSGIQCQITLDTDMAAHDHWWMHIALEDTLQAAKVLGLKAKPGQPLRAEDMARRILGTLISKLVIRGLPQISDAYVVRRPRVVEKEDGSLAKEPRFTVETEGADLRSILAYPCPHFRRHEITSNHVHHVWQVLGIDAAAEVLFSEINAVMSFDSTYIDPRHIAMVVDSITFMGKLVSMSRYGIKEIEQSPLLLASFEQTVEVIFSGCLHASLDRVRGISENIILGGVIPAGTGCIDILEKGLDPNMATAPRRQEDEGPRRITLVPPTRFTMVQEYKFATRLPPPPSTTPAASPMSLAKELQEFVRASKPSALQRPSVSMQSLIGSIITPGPSDQEHVPPPLSPSPDDYPVEDEQPRKRDRSDDKDRARSSKRRKIN